MKRPPANRLGMYDDIRPILDAALKSGGGVFQLATYGQAVHWRQRAYKFRKLYASIIASENSTAMSPYDKLTLPAILPDSSEVVIRVRKILGQFTPNEEPFVSDVEPEDELVDIARQLRDKLAKGDIL